ncbi:MAG: (S)-phenoxypropionate/alpha-ketoglutarate-dioxygenase [Alphaproteobacteria bacterium MarineAlpha4_Bin2]|nr:MAG: (S)-phenoxypropionate/alpha-ketoglutarate-dioxygenase [Alphaproteobacteria bacterium MarineAlpha4_Bin2]
MKMSPLTDSFGVRIEGVNLSQPLDEATFQGLRTLWMEHRVAVISNQELDDDQLIKFTERFGPLFVHAQTSLLTTGNRKEVMELSNLDGVSRPVDYELDWHTDQTYTPQPVFGTILYGIVAPQVGGQTLFSDLAGAYDNLPDELRQQVEGATAVYSAEPRPQVRDTPLNEEEKARILDCTHPLVRTHPYLKRKAVYLSPLHIKTIGALSEDDSLDLLQQLTIHATSDTHIYRHTWSVGDLVMWDNTSVMHSRTPMPAGEKRYLKRTGFYLPDELAVPF